MNKQNSSMEVVWLIRDARGLSTNEKAFLFTVASRGIAKTTRERLMQDLNCSTGTITNLVASLGDKDLINVYPGYWKDGKKTPTAYTVKADVLATLVPKKDEANDSVQEMNTLVQDMNTLVHEVNTPVQEMNEPVHLMATKGTTKVTDKETSKRTEKIGAIAPVEVSFPLGIELDSSLSKQREAWLSYNFSLLEELANSSLPDKDGAVFDLAATATTDTPPLDPATPHGDSAEEWERRIAVKEAKRLAQEQERDARIAEMMGYHTGPSSTGW